MTAHMPVGDHKVLPAVVVDVDKRGAEADVHRTEHADAGRLGFVNER